jgi:methyl-accepting chemotaxis protein
LQFKIKGKRLGLLIKAMTVQRWTDEMLDNLASSVIELRNGFSDMREGMADMREGMVDMREGMVDMRESISEIRDSVDGLRITSQALLQVAAQSQREMDAIKERQAENDQRFNVLLEEVRFLIRGKTDD